ncbi:exonuclease SbcCD subunit D [Lacticigenium naphthae]|uniref:exonuclease SbcCD subunit D n=1 Tax=Lacticigenium naphthae TaxID=515351 RepID=UPI0004251504|nr:exonuclease SbcCD subunit D [Lacticigenium naphthae]
MKILHTADWHIGKIVNEFSMLEDQEYIFNQLLTIVKEQEIDVVIMAGDLYDRSIPPKDAVTLANNILTTLVQEMHVPVLVIAGNHDSNERLEYGAQLLEKSQLFIEGTVKEVTRKIEIGNNHFYLLPFADPATIRYLLEDDTIHSLEDATQKQMERIKADWDPEAVNILIAHGYIVNNGIDSVETSDSERPLTIGTAEYVDAHLFDAFDYVALGHLHKAQKVGREQVRYSGSPLKYSKSEVLHKKQVRIVTIEEEGITSESIPLKPFRDMRVVRGTFQELLQNQSSDYVFIELEDTQYVMDAMNQLKKRYPYAMSLEYRRTVQSNEEKDQLNREQMKNKSVPELFKDFFAYYKQQELDEESEQAVKEVVEEIGREL